MQGLLDSFEISQATSGLDLPTLSNSIFLNSRDLSNWEIKRAIKDAKTKVI